MASHVQVILKQDVDKLGRAGALVRVKPGYARNYLVPRSIAVVATRGGIRQVEHEQRDALRVAAKLKKLAEGQAIKIYGLTVEVSAQAGEGDKLFGSVTSRDVHDALASHGADVDKKKIVLDEPIKKLGDHTITVKFGSEVSATFTVRVVAS